MTIANHTGPTVVQYTPSVTTVTFGGKTAIAQGGIIQDPKTSILDKFPDASVIKLSTLSASGNPAAELFSGLPVVEDLAWDQPDEQPDEQPQTVRTVVVPPDTPLYCYCCHDIEAPEYRLRRSSGKYITLCYRHGEGCWERSARPMCSFKDHQGVQCDQVAEFDIAFGRDMLVHMPGRSTGAALSVPRSRRFRHVPTSSVSSSA